jgi:hypothetical protein
MCFVFICEQTATCANYSINWSVFITEMKSVYCAVRTGSLNKAVCASYLRFKISHNSELVKYCCWLRYVIQNKMKIACFYVTAEHWDIFHMNISSAVRFGHFLVSTPQSDCRYIFEHYLGVQNVRGRFLRWISPTNTVVRCTAMTMVCENCGTGAAGLGWDVQLIWKCGGWVHACSIRTDS